MFGLTTTTKTKTDQSRQEKNFCERTVALRWWLNILLLSFFIKNLNIPSIFPISHLDVIFVLKFELLLLETADLFLDCIA